MNKRKIITSSVMSVFSWTFIVFLILKLTGVIALSWWWVTAPIWVPVIIVVLLIVCIALFQTVAEVFMEKR